MIPRKGDVQSLHCFHPNLNTYRPAHINTTLQASLPLLGHVDSVKGVLSHLLSVHCVKYVFQRYNSGLFSITFFLCIVFLVVPASQFVLRRNARRLSARFPPFLIIIVPAKVGNCVTARSRTPRFSWVVVVVV